MAPDPPAMMLDNRKDQKMSVQGSNYGKSVSYSFKTLDELAAWFEQRSENLLKKGSTLGSRRLRTYQAQAYAWRDAAYMLHNSKVEE